MKRIFTFFFLSCLGSLHAEDTQPAIEKLTPAEVKATWQKLNNLITKAGSIDSTELERAQLEGVLQKLGKNARLVTRAAADAVATGVDFKQEMLPRSVLYARLGDLTADNITQLSDAIRKETKAEAMILDLRATKAAANFEQASQLLSVFAGGGKTLFSLVGSTGAAGKNFAGQGDALFTGILVVLINEDTNGPGETVAASLRQQTHALLIGTKTAGQALDFTSLPINPLIDLEVAVGRITLPGLAANFLQNGVQPDITVNSKIEDEREIVARSEKEGMAAFIFEVERPHLNEASLVAGRNPELDNFQARKTAKEGKETPEPIALLDRSLQRALDTATSLLILRSANKPGN